MPISPDLQVTPTCAPNIQSTSSTTPAAAMAPAPRVPSSAGWKMRRTRPVNLSLLSISQCANPKPEAVWESCPQACMSPGISEAKPSLLGTCSGSVVSDTNTQSMSKRNAVVGPARPVSNSATAPVYPARRSKNACGTPCSSARCCALATNASFRPNTAFGSMTARPHFTA